MVVASSAGRLLRLAVNGSNLPVMGRNAQGPVLMRLLPGETVVGAVALEDTGSVIAASSHGLIKELRLKDLRRCERGNIGQIGMHLKQPKDDLVNICDSKSKIIAIQLDDGRGMRLSKAWLETVQNDTRGRELELGPNRKIIDLVPIQIEPH